MEQKKLRSEILSRIEAPRIPEREICLEPEEGLQTARLQNAIDTLARQGGGRLSLKAGVYPTGALQLKDGVCLHLAEAGTLLRFVPEDIEKNYPVVFSHWEGTPCYNYSALLYACDAKDIAVTGPGTMDGGADSEHWWNWHHQVEKSWSGDAVDYQLKDRMELRRMNLEGVPVAERRFGAGHYLRPNFVQFVRCHRVKIQGITLRHSPMWQLNPVLCSSVEIDSVTVSSHGYNNDGCDPESCDGVWIHGCRFDTGDDCISLKSGRDRDGREANIPCQNILIEENDFADGHGGIALGSEMSGGIRRVLARENRFASPNLTYALRLKTNAKRGGTVEQVMLCDSVMDCVHGAAVHGTMLYEDGRNGDMLPVFRDITIENITAHGGDYGIFLEAFPEVPITGLVLRNIRIDGAAQEMRSMNWKDAVVENVEINGKVFPRPGYVRILGVPRPGERVQASAQYLGGDGRLCYRWEVSADGNVWSGAGEGEFMEVPQGACWVRLLAEDAAGNLEYSQSYRVLTGARTWADRMLCRGILLEVPREPEKKIARAELAEMTAPLADPSRRDKTPCDTQDEAAVLAVSNGFLPLDAEGRFHPDKRVSRQEMATVAMQCCGVNYRNASSTMPVCEDMDPVGYNYGTNVAWALFFGFMELENGRFYPTREVDAAEAARVLDRVADFAGL